MALQRRFGIAPQNPYVATAKCRLDSVLTADGAARGSPKYKLGERKQQYPSDKARCSHPFRLPTSRQAQTEQADGYPDESKRPKKGETSRPSHVVAHG